MRNELAPLLQRMVVGGQVAGCVGAIGTSAAVLFEGAAGKRGVSGTAAMTTDAIFWIASMTKSITSTAVMQQVERGKLELDQPISPILPELARPMVLTGFSAAGQPVLRAARRAITLRHLLTHTSGHVYTLFSADMARYCRQMDIPAMGTCRSAALNTPLIADPGDRWSYGTGVDWAAKALERVTGLRLGEYLRVHLFEPLEMADTAFQLTASQRGRLVSVLQRQPDGSLALSEYATPQNQEIDQGGGGLYSTAADFLKFCRVFLRDGTGARSARILGRETIAQMMRNQIGPIEVRAMVTTDLAECSQADWLPGLGNTWGLGFLITTVPGPAGRSAGSFAWGGLANTFFWIDPARDLAGVLLMQQLPFMDA